MPTADGFGRVQKGNGKKSRLSLRLRGNDTWAQNTDIANNQTVTDNNNPPLTFDCVVVKHAWTDKVLLIELTGRDPHPEDKDKDTGGPSSGIITVVTTGTVTRTPITVDYVED